jgi:hypothetical protein
MVKIVLDLQSVHMRNSHGPRVRRNDETHWSINHCIYSGHWPGLAFVLVLDQPLFKGNVVGINHLKTKGVDSNRLRILEKGLLAWPYATRSQANPPDTGDEPHPR